MTDTPSRESKLHRFASREIREAVAHAQAGGQALHVWNETGELDGAFPHAPAVFKRNHPWAHLFDSDTERLLATARRLGVRVLKLEHRGTPRQHIDLCGGPLARAIAESEVNE